MSVLVSEKRETKPSSVRAFFSIRVEPRLIDNVAETLSKFDGIDQLYEATGESELITLITTSGTEQFRDVKIKIMKIRGVLNTGAAIVEQI